MTDGFVTFGFNDEQGNNVSLKLHVDEFQKRAMNALATCGRHFVQVSGAPMCEPGGLTVGELRADVNSLHKWHSNLLETMLRQRRDIDTLEKLARDTRGTVEAMRGKRWDRDTEPCPQPPCGGMTAQEAREAQNLEPRRR